MGLTASSHRPATTHTTVVAEHCDDSTRSGPWQRTMRPALSPPLCAQMLLGRRPAARVDVNMPSLAPHRACFAMFVACIDALLDGLRVPALCVRRARLCVMVC
jgi:hypothetical protein